MSRIMETGVWRELTGRSMNVSRDKSEPIRNDRRAIGFTLLEALIVIAILAVVTVILLPALSMARQMGVRSVCQANLHGIGTAVAAYSVTYNFTLPTYYADSSITFDTFRMRRDSGQSVNLGALLDYAGSPKVFYCPSQDGSTSPSIAYDTPENRWQWGGGGAGGTGGGGGGAGATGPGPGLNSSYPARFRKPNDPQVPSWTVLNYTNKVIYSDFIGIDDWQGRGRFSKRICAPHRSRGYNRLFGDGSVLWTQADQVNAMRPVTSAEPTADELCRYLLLLDVLRQ